MKELVSFFLLSVTSFFTLINPLGVMPVFNGMTQGLDNKTVNSTAKKAVLVSFITLLLFAITGQFIFKFFNISIASLKVVGGVLFFIMGQDMLKARLVSNKEEMKDEASYSKDIAVTPLAIPMITGPGAITNAIVLMEGTNSYLGKGLLILAIAVVCFITYLMLISGQKIFKKLGDTGNAVLMRLMGLIVMVIAVEFFFSGATPLIRNIFNIT